MIRKLQFGLLGLCLLFSVIASAQQPAELFREDFNAGNGTFTLNSNALILGSGSNRWTVNNQYDGKGVYPTTTTENHTVNGTITNPDSFYLHVYDTLMAGTVANCNYNDTVASDNFAYMSAGFCTKGFTDVHFTFFYLAQGNITDYGTVYYSVDGGAWTPCGAAQYTNQVVWKQEDITLPAFEDHFSVQFGFRWVNANGGGPNKISFGVDDIIATGVYKPFAPLQVSVAAVSPDTVCAETLFKLSYKLSQPFCNGTYQVIMSDSLGSFAKDTINLGTFAIAQGDTAGSVTGFAPIVSGNCFKFRIDRVSTPAIKGIPAAMCFTVNNCSNTIQTFQPSVTYGPDTLCAGSVIDVPFFSTGIFNGDNQYVVQLSDTTGNFISPRIIAIVADSNAYDPFQLFGPNTIAGLVPNAPPGCNYYIRIISTSPSYAPPRSNYFGPFCIRRCDVTNNDMKDISVCITDTVGATDTIFIKTNTWNNNAHYGPGNKFIAQLMFPFNYFPITDIPLGEVTADSSTKLVLHIPPYDSLFSSYFLFPGTFYMRIISTNSSSQSDTLSTLVRLTIGYSDPEKPVLAAYDVNFKRDSVFCGGDEISVLPLNWFILSNYQWETSFPLYGLTNPFSFDPPLTFDLNSSTPAGNYWFRSREVNNGCFSDWSDTIFVKVMTKPAAFISTTSTCQNDTVTYSVQQDTSAHYNWTITGSPFTHHFIKNNGSLIEIRYDSLGTYKVTVNATNRCGTTTGISNSTVSPKPAKPILNPTVNNIRDTIVSSADLLKIAVTNYNSSHIYYWQTSVNISGLTQPFTDPSPFALHIDGSLNNAGLYWFISKESVNGCFSEWSDTLWIYFDGTNSIDNVDAMNQIRLVPNPATDEINIQMPKDAGVYELELTDMVGKVMIKQPVANANTRINIEAIPAGVYLVRLTGKGSKVFKLVKE